jgi:hypothetical protein
MEYLKKPKEITLNYLHHQVRKQELLDVFSAKKIKPDNKKSEFDIVKDLFLVD